MYFIKIRNVTLKFKNKNSINAKIKKVNFLSNEVFNRCDKFLNCMGYILAVFVYQD